MTTACKLKLIFDAPKIGSPSTPFFAVLIFFFLFSCFPAPCSPFPPFMHIPLLLKASSLSPFHFLLFLPPLFWSSESCCYLPILIVLYITLLIFYIIPSRRLLLKIWSKRTPCMTTYSVLVIVCLKKLNLLKRKENSKMI